VEFATWRCPVERSREASLLHATYVIDVQQRQRRRRVQRVSAGLLLVGEQWRGWRVRGVFVSTPYMGGRRVPPRRATIGCPAPAIPAPVAGQDQSSICISLPAFFNFSLRPPCTQRDTVVLYSGTS
jgi:hypothetical protein